ncbi:MAG: hypothetical protein DRR19_01925 [Candidatus Parabeggiatoa sp. nov. 1]|nr:MAG: hypothetical protein DRR19_01925 [Gammaproteobacteria bacterium]
MRKGVKLQAAILAALASPAYAGDICLPSDASIKSLPLVLQCFEAKLKNQQKQIAFLVKENQCLKQKKDALTVSSDGNVGIGTTSPQAKLHVNDTIIVGGGSELIRGDDPGTGNNGLLIQSAQTVEINIDSNDAPMDIFRVTNGSARQEIFRVQGDGNVGIGTTSPKAKLHTDGGRIRVSESDGAGQSGVVELSNGTKTNYIFTAADGHLYARTDSATHHVLLQAGSASGNVGIGTTSPGATLEVVGTVNLNGKNLSGSGLTCTDVEGSKSGRADDAPSYASCPSGYTLTGCTCQSPWNSCDGAKPDRANNRCIAYNKSGGAGVFAEATCCKVH